MWLTLTLALIVLALTPLSALANDHDEASGGLAVGATVLITYGALTSLVIAPRKIFPKLRSERPENEAAVLRWTLAVAPFLIGCGAVSAGAQQWSLSAGILVSVVLLVVAARSLRRAERGQPPSG